ncbi:hypothetical protein E2C01_072199 [Portunus trituberculatus]|uniref:RNA-directed DNA polymerase from mobile element jockey n=1 Tax=Portunus trituberculatus TaxID=210409 RepID=A0A5B7I6I8_PORTR|nr:hypothetical protein [Portunus trituberculatus]
MTWGQHVSNIISSATYELHLRRLKKLGTPSRELASMFSIFIHPRLKYAFPAWSSSLIATQRHQPKRVQKRVVRLILGTNYTI